MSSKVYSSRHALVRWFGQALWAISDQMLFALSGFVLNLALARGLDASEYGAFSIAFTIFLLLSTIYNGLFTEPLLIFGASHFEGRFEEYFRVLVVSHWGFCIFISLILSLGGIICVVLSSKALGNSFFALALAAPSNLFMLLLRRACYAQLRVDIAAVCGSLYLLLVLGGLYSLHRCNLLSAATGILAIAAISLIVAILMMRWLRLCPMWKISSDVVRMVWIKHWSYGRYAIVTGFVSWLPINIFYLLLPLTGGLETSGKLRALMNLVLPMLTLTGAVGMLLLSSLARYRSAPNFRSWVLLATICLAALAATYSSIFMAFPLQILELAYGGRYNHLVELVHLVVPLPVAAVGLYVFHAALGANEQAGHILLGYASAAAVSITAGLSVMTAWSLPIAVITPSVAYLVGSGVMVKAFLYNVRTASS